MFRIDPKDAVVLVMDYQTEIVEEFLDGELLVDRTKVVLEAARRAGIPIAFIVVTFRDGYPEVGEKGMFQFVKGANRLLGDRLNSEVHQRIAPKPGDVVVNKKRGSGFVGSDLGLILRALGRNTLYMMGLATSGVVLYTTTAAADMDYDTVVISDCCSDHDEEVHRVLTEKVFPRSITAEEFVAGLS